jgi:hypothetical protein
MIHSAGEIEIPMGKILNFRYNGTRDNPEGSAPTKKSWVSWKTRQQIELDESVGVQRNLNGCPVMYIPAAYMSPDAKPEEKAVYQAAQNQIRNYQRNEQTGFVMPNIFDEISKQRLFSLEPLEVKGSNSQDTSEIIRRYDLRILQTLFADILMMGQSSSGSFALSGSKTNIIEMAIERRMKEIASVFVNDLFKETFELNGWDTSRLPQLVFEFPEDYDSEEFSKMIQRIGAVNMFPRTPETISWIAKAMGFPDWQKFSEMSQEELDEMFTENETGAGEGMSEGMNNGTGKGNKNNSATNADNKA